MPPHRYTSDESREVSRRMWDARDDYERQLLGGQIRKAIRMKRDAASPGLYERWCLVCEVWFCYIGAARATCGSDECLRVLKSEAGRRRAIVAKRKKEAPRRLPDPTRPNA